MNVLSKPNSAAETKDSLLIRMGNSFTRVSQKYMPDPTIFAIALTILAFLLAMLMKRLSPAAVLGNWYAGLWELLTFAMQMAICIIGGAVVADAPVAKRAINRVASLPRNGPQAAFLVAAVTILLSYVQFGLSLAGGALLAKSIARNFRRRGVPCEYGLLVACAYLGQMTWCVGFSNSVGLSIATPGHLLESEIGLIPLNSYIFNPMNLFLAAGFIVLLPLFAYLLHPKGDNVRPIPDYALRVVEEPAGEASSEKAEKKNASVGELLNNSHAFCWIIGGMGILYVVYAFVTKGFAAFDLNLLNAILIFGGLLLHGTVANYVSAFARSTSSASGIIFQFPLYAGIMGIIKYSGLVSILAGAIASISTPFTFYFWTFLSASIVNMFVPSGGGQWAVQGPIAVESVRMIAGGNVLKACQAVAYGNSWTNMCQPFWALALLGFTGLKAKDIMGYSTAIMLGAGLLFTAAVFFFPV